jgi:hypothetical protein
MGVWMRRGRSALMGAAALLMSGPVLPCFGPPQELTKPHAQVVAEARQIFLAEIVDTRPKRAEAGVRENTMYRMRVLRVLKGKVASTYDLAGEGDLSGIWDTTFDDHSAPKFWNPASGRMGFHGDCTMVSPAFVKGRRYLLVLGGSPDTKQYERVDNSADLWLKYVEKQAQTGRSDK